MRKLVGQEIVDAFWAKVRVGGPDECWEWQGAKNSNRPTGSGGGYGNMKYSVSGKTFTARTHRFSFNLAFGPFDQNKMVLHRCDNPSCVNPAHLSLGDNTANMRDMVSKGRNKHPMLTGNLAHSCKLTEEQVREIFTATGPQHAIAARYGIRQQQVSRIKTGKEWHHLNLNKEMR